MPLSVLIADDHQLVRRSLQLMVKEILGFNAIVEFAGDGRQVLEKLKRNSYDLLLTDLNMPDTDDISFISAALALRPELKILIITVKPDNVFAARFLKAGAMGYVNKSEPEEVIYDAIRLVSQGRRYVSRAQAEWLALSLTGKHRESPFDKLSPREFEVMLLLLKGHGIMEVGEALSIKASTASSFRSRIFEKLEVKNLMALSRLAQQYQIFVEPGSG